MSYGKRDGAPGVGGKHSDWNMDGCAHGRKDEDGNNHAGGDGSENECGNGSGNRRENGDENRDEGGEDRETRNLRSVNVWSSHIARVWINRVRSSILLVVI